MAIISCRTAASNEFVAGGETMNDKNATHTTKAALYAARPCAAYWNFPRYHAEQTDRALPIYPARDESHSRGAQRLHAGLLVH